MKLHFQRLGEGQPLIILNGLFGSSDNWRTLGKQLAADYEVFLVDQRNHGKSPHSDEFSYEAMAADLYELVRDENLDHPIWQKDRLVEIALGPRTSADPRYLVVGLLSVACRHVGRC